MKVELPETEMEAYLAGHPPSFYHVWHDISEIVLKKHFLKIPLTELWLKFNIVDPGKLCQMRIGLLSESQTEQST